MLGGGGALIYYIRRKRKKYFYSAIFNISYLISHKILALYRTLSKIAWILICRWHIYYITSSFYGMLGFTRCRYLSNINLKRLRRNIGKLSANMRKIFLWISKNAFIVLCILKFQYINCTNKKALHSVNRRNRIVGIFFKDQTWK